MKIFMHSGPVDRSSGIEIGVIRTSRKKYNTYRPALELIASLLFGLVNRVSVWRVSSELTENRHSRDAPFSIEAAAGTDDGSGIIDDIAIEGRRDDVDDDRTSII